MGIRIAIEWASAPGKGQLEIGHGELVGACFAASAGTVAGANFSSAVSEACRMELDVAAAGLGPGPNPTTVTVRTAAHSFTFCLRDVQKDFPILIPAYGVAVTTGDDPRNYAAIFQANQAKGLYSNFQQMANEPEESYESAAASTRELRHPIWLGVGRDVRIFEAGLRGPMLVTDYVQPRFHGNGYYPGMVDDPEYVGGRYGFVAGRGWHCTDGTRRWLDEDVLPIFHMERMDEDIRYDHTIFVALERSALTAETVRGTHFLVADGLSTCHALTEDQKKQYQSLRDGELNRDEETVLCCRISACNTARVPRHAFFKAVHPIYGMYGSPEAHGFDVVTGFGRPKDSELVYGVSKLDGKPMPQEEIAVLVPPGGCCVYEFLLPHRPISASRAHALARRDMDQALRECRTFWRGKLSAAARIAIPEKRIDDMVRAGLLQLDLTSYGIEPDGPVAATNGVYGPVSAEVWVNIHFFDSLGLHQLARRALMFFLEKQRADGFMQNFEGYMLDTGCVLFALGEHYRYTRDNDWVRQIAPKVVKACECIIDWRRRNQREELRGRGYGMLEGKAADPEDNERIYMLNAYAYIGLSRAAQMLAAIDPERATTIGREAQGLRADIRAAFFDSLATGPVIPLGDGTWCPTAGPWAGCRGPCCLFTDGQSYWTHGSMTARDDIIGTIHLLAQEVIDPDEPAATFVLNYLNELMFSRNVASTQPYYSQHPRLHLWRGEVRPFLKAYYNGLTSLADREIYSWWEHFFHVSPHKTHETAEFLMQTRWMLYLEEGETLSLLKGVPRAWLATGQRIELQNVASFFGPLSVSVDSRLTDGFVEAHVACEAERKPRRVEIRLPHPKQWKAVHVEGGVYDAERETICVEPFAGRAIVRAVFQDAVVE